MGTFKKHGGREAGGAGLSRAKQTEPVLQEQLRAQRIARLKSARATLAAEPLAPMTPQDISAEITAYRNGQRRAAGS